MRSVHPCDALCERVGVITRDRHTAGGDSSRVMKTYDDSPSTEFGRIEGRRHQTGQKGRRHDRHTNWRRPYPGPDNDVPPRDRRLMEEYGIINWRNVVTSVGIGLLGAAFVAGSGRPVLFSFSWHSA